MTWRIAYGRTIDDVVLGQMTADLAEEDRRRKATIVGKLETGALERRLPSVIVATPGRDVPLWHIGPGSCEQCYACDEPIGLLEYKQSWPGSRIVVHAGCAEAWRDEGERMSGQR